MSTLHDARLGASPLLEAALGVRSTIERFDSLLARFAPPIDDEPAGPDDVCTELVLGAIAMRDQLTTLLEQRSAPDAARTPTMLIRAGLLR